MTIFYSAAKSGFFHPEVHGDKIPKDCVEITEETYQSLLQGQELGKVIVANATGNPVLANPPSLTKAQKIAVKNNVIISQIQDLETKHQPRALRDMLLYGDKTKLEDLDNQIKELRSQLQ